MLYTSSLIELIQQVENKCDQKATGKLIITTDSMIGEFHFFSGQLIYVNEQTHRIRRWKRFLEKYFHNWHTEINLDRVSNSKLWECQLLNKAILNREISLLQVQTFIREIFVEYLFELSIVKEFKLQWQNYSNKVSPLPLALGLSRGEFHSLIKRVIQNKNEWKSAGLGEFNLNLAPKLKNNSSFHSMKVSSHYLNGHHTLWDIAIKEQKNITEITSYLFGLIEKNIIEFHPVEDLHDDSSSSNSLHPFKPVIAKNKLVAIIDDNPESINNLVDNLKSFGYQVLIINEPMSGMSKLMQQKPDLILLDTYMPTVDGYSVCKFLRTTPLFTQTPIILLTNYDNSSELDYVRFVGANDLLCKPIQSEKLMSKVQQCLSDTINQNQQEDSLSLMAA